MRKPHFRSGGLVCERTTYGSLTYLYLNPLEYAARIQNLRGHPYEFYQKDGLWYCRGDAGRERMGQAGPLYGDFGFAQVDGERSGQKDCGFYVTKRLTIPAEDGHDAP